jgi:eukaryotic-like serine/threonine-protein kinase
MPAPATATDFLDMVRKSGLVPPDRFKTFLQRTASADDTDSVDRLADALVRTGQLTFFQAKQLKQGRYKRFQIASKYRLLELLGVGGMGAVYLCEHEFMKRLVAVKVLPVDKIASDPTALQRFYREARAVAALDHPNVVHAYDIDKFEGVHFLVMEYVDGSSLQDVVGRYAVRRQFFDPVRAAHYIAQGAAGLQHATELGLIHRDVKPGNLLLDRGGVIKVLDMGLARFFDERHDGLTERFDDSCVLGTADYLAPEQASNDPVDVRADIYGLGGTLYYLLTGQSPFPDGNVAQKLVAHQTQAPRPVTAFRSDVPAELLTVLAKMMEKKPINRYQTPAQVIAALEPWTQQPIDPPPAHEMPVLSPAVMELIGLNPIPGRADGSAIRHFALRMPGAPGSGGSAVRVTADRSEATVPTQRGRDTAPMPRVPPPVPLSRAPVPPPTPPTWQAALPMMVAVGVGSFLLATVLLVGLYLLTH